MEVHREPVNQRIERTCRPFQGNPPVDLHFAFVPIGHAGCQRIGIQGPCRQLRPPAMSDHSQMLETRWTTKIAFLFPDKVFRYRHGKDLNDRFGRSQTGIPASGRGAGFSLSRLCFEGPREELKIDGKILNPQYSPSVWPRTRSWRLAVCARISRGHSLGEYSALVAAGAISLEEAVVWSSKGVSTCRRPFLWVWCNGRHPWTGGIWIEAVCQEAAGARVSPANFNSAHSKVVIAGHPRRSERAMTLARGTEAPNALIPLPVSAPFHCALMCRRQERLRADLDRLDYSSLALWPDQQRTWTPDWLRKRKRSVTACCVRFRLRCVGSNRWK